MGDAQAFGQQHVQFIADAVAPMAHPRTLARQFVLHVDDLIEAGFEQVVVIGFFRLFRSHQIPQKQCL
jgi:hypothetical protein